MEKLDVQIEAWAPFGEGRSHMFENPILSEIGKSHHKTVAQVILRWLTQRGVVALAKSTHIERMRENIEIFDFKLTDKEMKLISGIDTKTSQFFNHQTPEAVDMFVKFVSDRKIGE